MHPLHGRTPSSSYLANDAIARPEVVGFDSHVVKLADEEVGERGVVVVGGGAAQITGVNDGGAIEEGLITVIIKDAQAVL